ncbi:putative methyltransferase-domain-containing protein [Pyronema domesticum]|uniref:Protein N-terminal and lysine N-methyltransferase EFM7 n=1 Tax=Pyronema omphalodes (strain CBS 100304) TaxID=1076935 RepID=U4KW48_PYROM|nr:putative methyltransferase-domain-containing protein [Pyronema domesticum]CCX05286.1 Similar to Putative nicotinamide N-methyltransferase; acc. no. Q7S634 [Pyronema omphalodes CBS 100304]
MFDSDSEDDGAPFALIPDEPADFRPPPPQPTTSTYTLTTAPHETLSLRLVGHNPLWGHHLWNAGIVLSAYLEQHTELFAGKTVLELGAGAGLPALTCALRGATKVVITDYPDAPLVDNLWINIRALPPHNCELTADGYIWGNEPLPMEEADLVILSDLLFNHSEHQKLLQTVLRTMKKDTGKAVVFFTPHRPWLKEKDLSFLELCRENGLKVEPVLETLLDQPMFEEDPGDRDTRRTVYGFEVTWA